MKDLPDFSRIERVLVIKQRHLGDVLLSSPVFSNLKKAMPLAKIDAYIWKEAAPVLEGHPAIDRMILYDRKWKGLSRKEKWGKEIEMLKAIRCERYDLVINLTEGDRGALVALVSKAPYRVGVDPGKSGFLAKRKIYTHLVKPCHTPRHTVERDLDALRCIGVIPSLGDRTLTFAIPDEALQSAKTILDSYDIKPQEFTLIHPVSRWRFKCLPPKRMAAVIDRLDGPVILTGGPADSEQAMLEEIVRAAGKEVINLGGKTSLKELGALMLFARGVITVDSVSLHIASALAVPTVALFGPTQEKNWGPWGNKRALVVAKRWSCRPCLLDGCGGSKMSDCLWNLSPTAIVEAYEQVAHDSAGAEAVSNEASSAASLLTLNSLETKETE